MTGLAGHPAISCHATSRRRAAASSMPTSASLRRISPCSSAMIGSVTGAQPASASCSNARTADPSRFRAHAGDVHSDFAHQILPALVGAPLTDDLARRSQALLRDWDGRMTADAPQPLIFNAWTQYFYGAVLAKAGIGVNDAGPLLEFVAYVLSPAGAHWCGGDCNPLLQSSLTDALRDLSARFRQRPRRLALGCCASGALHPSHAARCPGPQPIRDPQYCQPRRRQHRRSRRPGIQTVSIRAWAGVSRRL